MSAARTFHNDPALKARLLDRIAAHERADSIAQGIYWGRRGNGEWGGCAVGCSLRDLTDQYVVTPDGGWHAEMERVLGIPEWLAALEDRVFEELSFEDAKRWPRRFSEAVPVGVSLNGVADRLAVRRLREDCLPLAESWPDAIRAQVVAAIEEVSAALEGRGDRESAARAAEAAAWAGEAAASAAEAAALAAALAAESAEAAARAETAAWQREAARIIQELARTEPQPQEAQAA